MIITVADPDLQMGRRAVIPGPSSGSATEIEDIAWPSGDTNFIFECWKYLSQVIDTDEIPT